MAPRACSVHAQCGRRVDTREGVDGVRSTGGRRAGLDALLLFSSRLRLAYKERRSLNTSERSDKDGSSEKAHGIG